MKAEDQDAGLIFASTTKDRGLNDIRGFQSEVAGGKDARFPKFEDTILRPRGKPGTAIQFQRRELVAVPVLQMIVVCRRCGQKQKPRHLGGAPRQWS